MKSVSVNLGTRGYRILVGSNLAAQPEAVESLRALLAGHRYCLISDSHVYPLYGTAMRELAAEADADCRGKAVIPAGESSKTLATVAELYRQAVAAGLDRQSLLLALGGGVVGDLAGFCAATFLRGIAFASVPTSLLAMVDSSVGGKTGVDLPEGKNLVGAFHQPKLVWAELAFLQSLPKREWSCGLAEALKYGVIMDPELFDLLDKQSLATLRTDAALQERLVARCCELKAEIVAEDETENGRRAILNYGHTFGHAIEALGNYSQFNHGEAIAIGMQMAAQFAVRLGLAAPELVSRQAKVLRQFALPVTLPPDLRFQPADIVEAMQRDKKAVGGQLRCVLPHRIGEVSVVPVANRDLLLEVIGGFRGEP